MRNVIYKDDYVNIDSGLFFGRGVFETILVKNDPVFLEEHIERLNNSISCLNLGEEISLSEVKKFIRENNIRNKALKIVITEKNLIYTTREIKYNKEDYINGFKVKISNVLRNSTSRVVNFKTLNYLENIIEYELAIKEGFNESIFLNENGFVAEGCTSNIFIIKNNKIFTPKKCCGLLPGVVRKWVIDNYEVIEKNITKDELLNSDEIFLTNSLVGVIKVTKVEDKLFKSELINNIKKQYDKAINGGE